MTQVTHSNFGTGTIVSQDENNVTVDFSGSIKTLVIKYANLLNADGSSFYTAPIASQKKKYKSLERTVTPAQMDAHRKSFKAMIATAEYFEHKF